jgi:hypothetical protein
MMQRPHPPNHLDAKTHLGAQRGIVLLAVLVMLVVASAWASYAWRQVFWQQRMLHSQGLEQMAWHAAEAGALAIQQHVAQHIALNPSLALMAALPGIHSPQPLPGSPAGHWSLSEVSSIVSTQANTQAVRIAISGHISDPQYSGHHIAQSLVLVDIEATPTGLHITRWQRVYPR